MLFFKSFSKRLIMTILFVGAIITTFESVSGIDIKTLASYAQVHEGKTKQTTQIPIENRFQFLLPLPTLYESVQKYSTLTYSVIATAQTPSFEEAEDWSKYPTKNVTATGYTAGVESTGKNPGHPLYGITYSGVKVKRDLYSTIAADPKVFPIGTILFIPGYGYGVVADTGSVIKGNIIDLYYDTVEEVYSEWGKKTLDVYVIKEGNGKITEEELTALNEAEAVQVFRQGFLKKSEKE